MWELIVTECQPSPQNLIGKLEPECGSASQAAAVRQIKLFERFEV
jgi:hypothetical protein